MSGKKKILVLFYPDPAGEYNCMPYPLLYLERVLRDAKIELKLIDERFDKSLFEYVEENHHQILALGFSVIYGNQLLSASEKAIYIKHKYPYIQLIWGGYFAGWLPEVLIREPYVDFVIKGQGELPLKNLTNALLSSDLNKIQDIGGLYYKHNGHFFSNKPDPNQDPFSWSEVNYKLVDIEKYVNNGNLHYIASLGCNHFCNFCFVSQSWKGNYYCKKADSILADISYFLATVPSIKYISFDDTNFFTHKENVIEFCKKLITHSIKIKWCGTTRISEFLELYSDEDVFLLKQAGCDTVYAGAESGDEEVLFALNKKLSVEKIISFNKILNQNSIKPSLSFMVLFPDNPDRDLGKTLKLIMQLKTDAPEMIFTINAYIPMRKNKYYFVAKKMGWVFPFEIEKIKDFIRYPQSLPWQNKSHFVLLNRFADFYFRFCKADYYKIFPKNQQWFYFVIGKLSFPLIKKRFAKKSISNTWDAAFFLMLIDFFSLFFKSPFKTNQKKYMTPRAKNF
ncbi:MAG: radical SAM protein [Bacteroidales bacterium]|nr:radical SAM protein [Bacteroidales bacterium]